MVPSSDFNAVEAVVHKKSPDTKLGIGLKDIGGDVYISNIASDGLFASSDLKPGYRLVSIGGVSCKGLSKSDSIKILKASSGNVSIRAEEAPEIITVSTAKDPKNPSVGIGLRVKNGYVVVGSIKDDSIFKKTKLAEGQRIISVNKTSCQGMNQIDVAQLFKAQPAGKPLIVVVEALVTKSKITIRESPSTTKEIIETIVVRKPSADAKLGVGLSKGPNGSGVVVSKIMPDGLFAKCENLNIGDRLISINQKDCEGLTYKQCIKLLKEATGTLTIRVGTVPAAKPEASLPKVSVEKKQDQVVKKVEPDAAEKSFLDPSEGPSVEAPAKEEEIKYVGPEEIKYVEPEEIKYVEPEEMAERSFLDPIGVKQEEVQETIEENQDNDDSLETIVVHKESADTKLGIGLSTGPRGSVVVSKLIPGGLFAKCDNLKVNARVVSINNKNCKGMKNKQCIKMLKEATGKVSIRVENPIQSEPLPDIAEEHEHEDKSTESEQKSEKFVEQPVSIKQVEQEEEYDFSLETPETIVVHKPSVDSKIGIGLVNGPRGSVLISKITPDGLFAKYDHLTHPGTARLISVNGTDCLGFTNKDCIALFKGAVGELKVCVGIMPKILSFEEFSTIVYGVVADDSVLSEMGHKVSI